MWFLTDIFVPSDTNASLKIFNKSRKYKDLEIEVMKMWHFKTSALPIVISAWGIVAKATPNYVSQTPGAPSLTELQQNNTYRHRTYPTKITINVI